MHMTTARRTGLALGFLLVSSLATPALASAPAAPAAAGDILWSIETVTTVGAAAPAVADLDGDGTNEVVLTIADGRLQVRRADGSLVWKRTVEPVAGSRSAGDASPTVADVDGDDVPEILVATGRYEAGGSAGGIVVFDLAGTVRWRAVDGDHHATGTTNMPSGPDGVPEPVLGSPAVADLDGDGRAEVVIAGHDFRVHAFRGTDGSPLPGWSSGGAPGVAIPGAPLGGVLAVDLDGDRRDEIVVGVIESPEWFPGSRGAVLALEWESGAARTRWDRTTAQNITGPPVALDLDGDGGLEVVFATSRNPGSPGPALCDGGVTALQLADGADVEGWPVALNGVACNTAPAIGDLDRDGLPELVVAGTPVTALRRDGSILWTSSTAVTSPVLADADGDGDQDVLAGGGVLAGTDGAVIRPPDRGGHAGSVVGDLGSMWAAVVPVYRGSLGGISSVDALALAAPGAPAAWTHERGTPTRSGIAGIAVGIEASPSGAGYWTVSSDGAVVAYGDAVVFGPPPTLLGGESVTGLSSTPTGLGYWLFTDRGRVLPRGDAVDVGDVAHLPLNGPVLDAVATPSGLGVYLVASDGGVFALGDAEFHGSMGGVTLNAPVQSLVPDPDGAGYWLVAADGGVFAFDAPFTGSIPGVLAPGQVLNAPVTGMVSYGDGYVLVAADGGTFVFSDLPFEGSLGANPPNLPVIDITAHPAGDGYWLIDQAERVYPFGDVTRLPVA
jgi:hypothetical protein